MGERFVVSKLGSTKLDETASLSPWKRRNVLFLGIGLSLAACDFPVTTRTRDEDDVASGPAFAQDTLLRLYQKVKEVQLRASPTIMDKNFLMLEQREVDNASGVHKKITVQFAEDDITKITAIEFVTASFDIFSKDPTDYFSGITSQRRNRLELFDNYATLITQYTPRISGKDTDHIMQFTERFSTEPHLTTGELEFPTVDDYMSKLSLPVKEVLLKTISPLLESDVKKFESNLGLQLNNWSTPNFVVK